MKKLVILLLSLMFPLLAQAEVKKTFNTGAVTVEQATTAEIEELFRQNDYDDYTKERSKFPRIYMKYLPTDWHTVPESDAKHRTFIRILLPLVLQINEEIVQERAQIEKMVFKFLKTKDLTAEDIKFIADTAEKYDVFTSAEGDAKIELWLRELLKRVDEVPPSIMIATAAIYTDWGQSRLADEAHSLYREEVWYTDEGLLPQGDEDGGYRYKIYADLSECIRARALKLNSHVNYDYFRESRQISHNMGRPPYGEQLAAKMLNDSNLKNIAGLIDYTFTFYKLNRTDYFAGLRDAKP